MQRFIGCITLALTSIAAGAAAAEEQPPAPQRRAVTVDVVIVEYGQRGEDFDGVRADSAEAILARIGELEAQKKSPGVTRVRLAALEQQPATVHAAERTTTAGSRGAIAARDREAGFAPAGAPIRQEAGTSVSVTPLVEKEGTILVELKVESARPSRGPGDPPNREAPGRDVPVISRGTASLSFQSTLRLVDGQPQIAQTIETSSGAERSKALVIVTAKVGPHTKGRAEAAQAAEKPEIGLFPLHRHDGKAVLKTLSSLFSKPPLMAYDEQLKVLGVTGSKLELEVTREVLKTLGESGE